MKSKTREFKQASAAALSDTQVQQNLKGLSSGFFEARIRAAESTPGWEEARERAKTIKTHTIAHLDHYLEMAEKSVTEAGGEVFFATDAAAASSYVLDLAKAKGVKTAIKGKSMISEEMGLNEQLAEQEIEAIETDLGEYLIQLKGDTPFHIIAPALHMSRSDVSNVLTEHLGVPPTTDAEEMAGIAREQLREKFIQADMGITGANFVVAETGTLVLVTNEGNGRMCTSMPRIHVAIMGMEKVIPSMNDLGMFLRLLIRSATGQRTSSYVTLVNGPRGLQDEDGPDEFHLVIVDNGRSKMLADSELREALNCLRCGACLNACPVYRKVGGHAYGWVYSGPIGAVVSPMLTSLGDAKDLPYASSLCGACREVCPVKINIPRMLLHLRHELSEGQTYPSEKRASWVERAMFKGWRTSVRNGAMLGIANRLGRLLLAPWSRGGRIDRLPPPLSGWTRHRFFPKLAARPFRARWKDTAE